MLTIACFHRVVDASSSEAQPYLLRGSALTTDAFDRQLQHLTETFDIVSEEVATAYLRGHHALTRPSCWLTFDDGYRDNLTHAAPLLTARGLTATLFVTTGILQSPWLLPVDRWYRALTHATRRQGTLADFDLPAWSFDLDRADDLLRLITGPEKRRFVEALPQRQEDLLQHLEDALLPTPPQDCDLYLTPAELHALKELGWSIGNHTRHHSLLPRLAPADVLLEVSVAASDLRAIGIEPNPWLAWPDGALDLSTSQLLRAHQDELALQGALSINPGVATPTHDRWSLPRQLIA